MNISLDPLAGLIGLVGVIIGIHGYRQSRRAAIPYLFIDWRLRQLKAVYGGINKWYGCLYHSYVPITITNQNTTTPVSEIDARIYVSEKQIFPFGGKQNPYRSYGGLIRPEILGAKETDQRDNYPLERALSSLQVIKSIPMDGRNLIQYVTMPPGIEDPNLLRPVQGDQQYYYKLLKKRSILVRLVVKYKPNVFPEKVQTIERRQKLIPMLGTEDDHLEHWRVIELTGLQFFLSRFVNLYFPPRNHN